ncbi:MAG TPA: HAD family hydrolase [Syntrophorhabdaceae bacterium]|nr:HAD family hydrolase [Syntrophorhabdaceae bacterium]
MKAVIFDFDGTLTELTLDFGHLNREILNFALQHVSPELIEASRKQYIVETIYKLAENMGERGPNFQKGAFERLASLELYASQGKDVFPYTRGLLRELKRRTLRTGIITRTCRAVLRQVFPDMDAYIDVAVTREDIREVKPDPAHVTRALDLLHVAPEYALVVGDHPTDIAAGRALNVKTAGVLTGRTERAAFEEAGATYIIDDIRGVLEVI